MTKTQELALAVHTVDALRKISRSLSRLAECEYNVGDLTERQQQREGRLKREAIDLARDIGF